MIYSHTNRLGVYWKLLKLTQTGYDGQKQLLDVISIDRLYGKNGFKQIYPIEP
jgi:hypothetical protein